MGDLGLQYSGSTEFISQPEMSCVCVWVCTFRCMFKSFDVRSGAVIYPNFRFQLFHSIRGHSMSLGLCPTKLPMIWDTRVGHSGVPASRITFRFTNVGFLPSLSSTMTSMTGS